MSAINDFYNWLTQSKATALKSFDPQQPRDENGKWTGGSGSGKIFSGESSGKYAGQYAGQDGYLTKDLKDVYHDVLDNQSDISLSMPIQRQTRFYMKSNTTKKTAEVMTGGIRGGGNGIIVNVSKPKAAGLGNSVYKSQVFKFDGENRSAASKGASDFIKSELNTP